jgi:N-acetylneuraminic acid mutarotase
VICAKIRRFGAIRSLCIDAIGFLVMGSLQASSALAQASGTWANTGTLNVPRNGHTATLLADGQVLVAGGQSSSGTILAGAELYNPATGKWTLTSSMANARTNHTATVLPNGEVLVVGGIGVTDPAAPCTATAELYNPSTGQWRTTGSMSTARYWQGATLLQNGHVKAHFCFLLAYSLFPSS